MRAVAVLLVVVHAALVVWAAAGLLEWFGAAVPWPAISNPRLPRPILLTQWLLVLAVAVVYLAGHRRRWRLTPAAMAFGYALMAVVCAVENALYLGNYLSMVLEYAVCAAILAVLFRTAHFRRRFA